MHEFINSYLLFYFTLYMYVTTSLYVHRYTGKWFTALNVMPLTATSAKVFWKTLHHREVQPYFFSFFLLLSDAKSQSFLRMLKKKSDATVSNITLRVCKVRVHYMYIVHVCFN